MQTYTFITDNNDNNLQLNLELKINDENDFKLFSDYSDNYNIILNNDEITEYKVNESTNFSGDVFLKFSNNTSTQQIEILDLEFYFCFSYNYNRSNFNTYLTNIYKSCNIITYNTGENEDEEKQVLSGENILHFNLNNETIESSLDSPLFYPYKLICLPRITYNIINLEENIEQQVTEFFHASTDTEQKKEYFLALDNNGSPYIQMNKDNTYFCKYRANNLNNFTFNKDDVNGIFLFGQYQFFLSHLEPDDIDQVYFELQVDDNINSYSSYLFTNNDEDLQNDPAYKDLNNNEKEKFNLDRSNIYENAFTYINTKINENRNIIINNLILPFNEVELNNNGTYYIPTIDYPLFSRLYKGSISTEESDKYYNFLVPKNGNSLSLDITLTCHISYRDKNNNMISKLLPISIVTPKVPLYLNKVGGITIGGVDVVGEQNFTCYYEMNFPNKVIVNSLPIGFYPGDTYQFDSTEQISGYVSSGSTKMFFTIKLGQPIFSNACTLNGSIIIRGVKGYITEAKWNTNPGRSGFKFNNPYNVRIINKQTGTICFEMLKSAGWGNVTNNTPLSAIPGGTGLYLEFS